jgi:tyrosine-protein phosphatase YwqE
MHSHILPGIDDGAKNMEQSLSLIGELIDMGYRKLTATPHIMGDFYKNTPAIIHEKLIKVQQAVNQKGWNIELKAAAEYYLDEWFMEKLRREEPLLTFGNGYVLFETSYINPPVQLHEAIFLMKSQNYKPVLAHPERYIYFHENFNKIKELYEMGVLLQININSCRATTRCPPRALPKSWLTTAWCTLPAPTATPSSTSSRCTWRRARSTTPSSSPSTCSTTSSKPPRPAR